MTVNTEAVANLLRQAQALARAQAQGCILLFGGPNKDELKYRLVTTDDRCLGDCMTLDELEELLDSFRAPIQETAHD